MKYGIDTRCQHLADDNKDEIYGAISYPIYQSATFARDRVGGGSGYDYSRLQNPTREHLEKIVASLEEGIDALAFSTGMAAITALMEIFKPGDHIIIDEDLYGGSIRLFHSINVKNGLTFTSVDLSSVDVEDYIQDNTKAIYAETPTNPMMRVSDLEELSKKAKKHELLLIVDNTFLSPFSDNKPRGHSGTASFYHQDDRSNPCTDGQLADPQRDQDAWSPYGQGTGKCTEDRTFSGEAGVCDKGALSGA